MTRRAPTNAVPRPQMLRSALVALSVAACSEGDAQKSWNELSTCLAGPAAQSTLAVRVARLRSIALGNTATLGAKTGYPARCGGPADDLYAALGTSSERAILKRKLHERLACADQQRHVHAADRQLAHLGCHRTVGGRRERRSENRSGTRRCSSASGAARAAEQHQLEELQRQITQPRRPAADSRRTSGATAQAD